ncbi:nucleotidyltransferase domain-containing protein [Candidatus Woesearchaeota archaeon]|nr:MAG: nucleotidyltransferase domain-containing protein [Candidatus Woesearchaeota archaeon]
MEFTINKRLQSNLERYSKEAFRLSAEFAKELLKEAKDFVKAVVLFGSAPRKERKPHDIDVLVIVDDVNIVMGKELVHTYRLMVQNLVAKISTKLHITTLRFTSFWEYVRVGDPVALNMLREGYALIDTNFFVPLQRLLQQGRIRPTPEAVWTYFNRARVTLSNASWHTLQAVIDLYWAGVDAAHAALMAVGEMPVTPEHIAALLEKRLVSANLLEKSFAKHMQELYVLQKEISTGARTSISAEKFDALMQKTKHMVSALEHVVKGRR